MLNFMWKCEWFISKSYIIMENACDHTSHFTTPSKNRGCKCVCVNLQKFAENNFIFLFIFPSIDNYLSGLKSPPLHQLYWNKSHFFSPQLRSRQSVSNNGRGDEILFILNHWKYNPTLEMPWPGRVNWKVLFEKFLATTNKGRPANTSF